MKIHWLSDWTPYIRQILIGCDVYGTVQWDFVDQASCAGSLCIWKLRKNEYSSGGWFMFFLNRSRYLIRIATNSKAFKAKP